MLSHFFSNCYWLSGNSIFCSWFVWYALSLCFFLGGKTFSYSSFRICFRCLLKSINLVSFNYRIMIANMTVGEWGSDVLWSFNCVTFLQRLRRIFAEIILWSEDTLFKRGLCLTVQSAIYRLLVYKYII